MLNLGLGTLFCELDLTKKEREALKDDDFGIPSKRKYPIHDARHVRMAIALFNKADDDDKPLLARNILKAAKKFKITVKSEAVKKWATKPLVTKR